MNIMLDNVNVSSNSGPNNFAKKLASCLVKDGHNVFNTGLAGGSIDVQLSFISQISSFNPLVQRLDGIWFNTAQDWSTLNEPIKQTYEKASAVIFQSEFNRRLSEHYFGHHTNSSVIHNGTDIVTINSMPSLNHPMLDKFKDVWCCASSWRPHKRLDDNIMYFLSHASSDTCLVVAGENSSTHINDDRIIFCGMLDWTTLISLFKRASTFLHLAWLDHCPNVVVDARASGCHIVCSSSGGTSEIAGLGATVILEDEWDYSPIELYSPPAIDFSKKQENIHDTSVDINVVAKKYLDVFEGVLS